MPGLNGTGPNGHGPMTGRGMGRCRIAENTVVQTETEEFPGFGRQGRRGGRNMNGQGRGFGRGCCDGSRRRIRGGR